MPKLIVDVECGAKECGKCQVAYEEIDINYFKCTAFRKSMDRDKWDGFRLPACLAAEADLTRLVEAAREASLMLTHGYETGTAEKLEAALAPFEEARRG